MEGVEDPHSTFLVPGFLVPGILPGAGVVLLNGDS